MIDEDISKAETLPAKFYREQSYFDAARESIFKHSWQFLGDSDCLSAPGAVKALSLLPGYLDEPLILSKDTEDNLNCLSNVCTHRGNLLVESDCHAQNLRCRYHGRRFGLDGRMLSAPGFENAQCFPTERDNLSKLPFAQWGKFLFAAIEPAFTFDELIAPVRERLQFLRLDDFILDPFRTRDYLVKANWALYCDNYLEGFHIPYVHPALASSVDCKNYRTELHDYCNLQIGIALNPSESFALPASSPDFGKNIAAYYYFLFPNMMFNFYPWGLSINVVQPISPDRSRISFITYVLDESKIESGAGSNLDRTEREDEAIIEQVQKGIRSHFYDRGRYSPEWEAGPHHFHKLILKFMASKSK